MIKTQSLNNIEVYINPMATTIQISKDLLKELKLHKMYDKESYEDIIWDLLEDTKELSDETLRDIKKSEEEIKKGKVHTLAEVEKKLKL